MNWSCKEKSIVCGKRTLLMGIINVTPDSFSDGGRYLDKERAVAHALQLVKDGADILDFGAQSTRPGSERIGAAEEWQRLEGVIRAVRTQTDVPISADTFYPAVAAKALLDGADIVNDVSGIVNPVMADLVGESGAGWILMHNGAGGTEEVKHFFENSITECIKLGVRREQLCVDVGIGFGKTYEQNLSLIANLKACKIDGLPLLAGFSRKRVIGAASGEEVPEKRIYGNIAADTAAVFGGADILRVHEIKGEIQGIKTAEELRKWIR